VRASTPKSRSRGASRARRRRCKRCANPPLPALQRLTPRCAAPGGARAGHGAAVPVARHGAARGQHQRHQTQEQGAAWRLLACLTPGSSADDATVACRRSCGTWSGCLRART
jgi:hypothetical protein